MELHAKARGARGQRIGADCLEAPPDDGLLQDEGDDDQRGESEEDRVREPEGLAAGDLGEKRGGRWDAAGDGEHRAIEQGIGADRGDDGVEPEEADEDAVQEAGGEREGHREQDGR